MIGGGSTVATALAWGVVAYAGLKFGRLMMAGERGYRRAPVPLVDRLRAGEPWLLAVAMMLAVPPSLLAARFHERKFAAVLTRSVDCYGRLTAVGRRSGTDDFVGSRAAYDRTQAYRATALDAADQLGLPPARAIRALTAAADTAARRPAGQARVEVAGCLRVEPDQPNA